MRLQHDEIRSGFRGNGTALPRPGVACLKAASVGSAFASHARTTGSVGEPRSQERNMLKQLFAPQLVGIYILAVCTIYVHFRGVASVFGSGVSSAITRRSSPPTTY